MSKDKKRKKRTEHIYGTTAGEVTELAVTVDHSGEIVFDGEMTNTYSEVTYDRRKSPKVLSRIPQSQKSLTFNHSEALKRNYEFRCAVDTNTRVIKGRRVSVTGIVTFKPVSIPGPKGIENYWKFGVPFCLEFIEVKAAPENFGWYVAWERMLIRKDITINTKLAMVVDSDLGNLNSYNQRTLPIFGTLNLPVNASLIYASSDAGKENVANKSLAVADSVSAQCLEAVEKGLVPFNDKDDGNEWFKSMRIIYPNILETEKLPVGRTQL